MRNKKRELFLSALALCVLVVGYLFADKSVVFGIDDTIPPTISQVKISQVTPTSSVITWQTNEDSDGIVNFSMDKNYCVSRDAIFGSGHEIVLEDLEPSTTYYVKTVSSDKVGNQSISGDFVFTTKPIQDIPEIKEVQNTTERTALEKAINLLDKIKTPEGMEILAEKVAQRAEVVVDSPIISGIAKVEPGDEYAVIRWTTDKESNSQVALASEGEYDASRSDPYTIFQGQSDEYVTEHEVKVIGLKPATVYHYRVSSKSRVGPEAKSADDTFTTKALTPQIVSVQLEKIEETAATVGWRTSIPTAGFVEYTNLRTKEVKTMGDPTFLTAHSVRLTDLVLNTLYSAVVVAENEAGEKFKSKPVDFRTVKDDVPPVISKVNNESTLFPGEDVKVQTIVSWETDEMAICQIFYHQGAGESKDILDFAKEPSVTTKHVQVVTNFSPATVYKYWINCEDRAGNKSKSENFVLFTPQKEKSIIDIIIENFETSFGWVKKMGM